jgi:hypothetical protein
MKIYADHENIKKQIDRGMKKYFPDFYNFVDLVPIEETPDFLSKFRLNPSRQKVFKIDFKHPKKDLLDQYIDKLFEVLSFYQENQESLRKGKYDYVNLLNNIYTRSFEPRYRELFRVESLINYIIIDNRTYKTKYSLHYFYFHDGKISNLKDFAKSIYEYVDYGYNVLNYVNFEEAIENLNKWLELLKKLLSENYQELTGKNLIFKFAFPEPFFGFPNNEPTIIPMLKISEHEISFFDIDGIRLFHLHNKITKNHYVEAEPKILLI